MVPLLDVINTPTAVTLDRGVYDVSFFAYNSGSLLSQASLAVHSNILLGVTFDVENIIGEETPRMNVPGVNARFKFTDGTPEFPILLAIGYSSFYSSRYSRTDETDNPFNRQLYGPYFVITKPVFIAGSEQHVHFGLRSPVQPVYLPEDTALFMSFDYPLGNFVPMIEIEHVVFDYRRMDEILYNAGFRFLFAENLAIEFNVISGLGLTSNRMVVIQFMDKF